MNARRVTAPSEIVGHCITPTCYGYKIANRHAAALTVPRLADMSPALPREKGSQALQQRVPCHLTAY